jgi:cyclophilin family peptidyl-prolyl cis-trans isomerase
MMSLFKRLAAFAGVVAAIFTLAGPALAQSGTPHLMLTLKDGVVDIELLKDIAPGHVERVIKLADAGAYDGVVFHRVIDGFMAQTGDVQFGKSDAPGFDVSMAGMGGSSLPDLKAEFSQTEHFVRGVVGAARGPDDDSANSQFFIMFTEYPSLDGKYTIWGKVVSGMEFVDNITRGEPPATPDKIIYAKIEYK